MQGDILPVGSYPAGASPYGALDMAGNVREWVNDWYLSSYYSSSPYANPLGPATGSYKVLRWCSWCGSSGLCTAGRYYDDQTYRYSIDGFRCGASR